MKLGFFPNLSKEGIEEILREALILCRQYNNEVYMEETKDIRKILDILGEKVVLLPKEELLQTIEMAFSFGGDGTILELAKEALPYDLPVCGINLGELGFLNQIEVKDMASQFKALFEGQYTIEHRSLLEGYIQRGDEKIHLPIALNDYVITRKEPGKMARINVSINDSCPQQYPSDGIILATATGSTGYNLSAHGPILSPTNHSIVLTPICPHLVQDSSIVLTEKAHITITMPQREKALYVSIDGTSDAEIECGDSLHIVTAEKTSPFVRLQTHAFFDVLFRKLNRKAEV